MTDNSPPALSQSIAWTLLSRSPFHAWHEHRQLGQLKRPPSPEMDKGSLVHELVLGGDRVQVFDYPDWRTNAAKGARAGAREDGRVPILTKQLETVTPVVVAISKALADNGLGVDGFKCEKRLSWQYGGLACEGTPDAVMVEGPSAFLWDLKTTKSLDGLNALSRKAASSGWALQREVYTTAIETLYPSTAGRITWQWVIAEVEPPYQVRVVGASATMAELGRLQWERAVVMWRELLARGWSQPWDDDWSTGLEAPQYELAREAEALDALTGDE